MSTELIINASLPEVRVALLQDQEIIEVLIERSELKGIVGNIYKGRVTRVLPGMQAAFVDIGLEKAAFLYVDDVYHHPMEAESEILEPEESTEESTEENSEERNDESSDDENATEILEASGDSSGSDIPAEGISLSGEESEEISEGASEGISPSQDSQAVASSEGLDTDGGEAPVTSAADAHEFIREIEASGTDAEEAEGESHEASLGAESNATESEEVENEEFEEADENASESSPETAEEGGKIAAPLRVGPKGRRGFRGRRGHRGKKGAYLRPKPPGRSVPVEVVPGDVVPEALAYAAAQTTEMHPGAERYEGMGNRPDSQPQQQLNTAIVKSQPSRKKEFRLQRGNDRRLPIKGARRSFRPVQIQDLLKEGQEVLVQIAKDPIATKGARLTCHISLPGRHLVCMPTIDHVGVSRRIDRDDERRRLRDFVEKNRPKGVGFIVRTASGKHQSAEKRIKQDIDYLTELWNEIREKAASSPAPSLIYEDLNAILKPIRDWVTEDVDKIIVDSRYHHGEIIRFVSKFMPALRPKVDLYHGDIPVFDAYAISTELSRALERKVWLKSGGYIVIDQAEALVAIDVNTGRYVGKRNLEDTILKTNLEAVKEIAYQLRLRNCGGIIILDFIDMEKEENRQRVYRALDEELKKDRSRPTIQKISDLGLVEMTRKRTVDTMIRVLGETCAHCEGRGFVKSKITVAYEILRDLEREGLERDVDKLLIQAHPDVIEKLAIDEKETLDALERRYGKIIFLQGVEGFHPEQFEISSDKKERKAREYERSRDEKLSQRKDSGKEGQEEGLSEESGSSDQRMGESSGRSGFGQSESDHEGDPSQETRSGGGREGGSRFQGRSSSTHPRDRQGRNARGGGRRPQPGRGRSGATDFEGRADAESPVRIQPKLDNRSEQTPGAAYPGEEGARLGAGNDTENTAMLAENYVAQEGKALVQPRPVVGSGVGPGVGDDDFSEEDRLAFLRAQAAQDAAIASLEVGSASPMISSRTGRGQNNSGRGGYGGGEGGRSQDRSGRSGGRTGGKGGKNKRGGRPGHGGPHSSYRGRPFQGGSAGISPGGAQAPGRAGWAPTGQPAPVTPREKSPEQVAAFSYREEARAAIEGIQKETTAAPAEVKTKDTSDFQD